MGASQRMVMDRIRSEVADIAIELVGEWMSPDPNVEKEPLIRQQLIDRAIAYEAAKRGHVPQAAMSPHDGEGFAIVCHICGGTNRHRHGCTR